MSTNTYEPHNGNLTQVEYGNGDTVHYAYDSLDRLSEKWYDNDATNKNTVTYDAGGNIRTMVVYDEHIDPDDPDYIFYNLLTTRDYRYQDSGNWKDLLTYYFGWDITYDDIGNPLNYRNGMTMTWVNGRRLASVTKSGVTTAYTYNDDGIRLTKKVGNNPVVTYETDGGKVLCQRTRIGTNDVYVFFFYDESGNAYAMEYEGDMYYYLRNGQNDVIGIIDDIGAVVARYTYDPWGKPLTVKDGNGVDIAANATHVANVNPFRYRGYFYDTETGFYYLQTRYYDPVTGRFINADGYVSTGQGILGNNMFAYCGNNPVNFVDTSGQFFLTALIVTAVVATCAIVLTGCSAAKPRGDLAAAPNLNTDTAPPKSYNCYGNGIGKQINTDPSGYNVGDSTAKTFEAVKKDLGGSKNVRKLDSINSPVGDDEFKLAMKCGPFDYHFIRLDDKGWYNKSGLAPGLYIPQNLVAGDIWVPIWEYNGKIYYNTSTYYNYETIYFAVKVGWYES